MEHKVRYSRPCFAPNGGGTDDVTANDDLKLLRGVPRIKLLIRIEQALDSQINDLGRAKEQSLYGDDSCLVECLYITLLVGSESGEL